MTHHQAFADLFTFAPSTPTIEEWHQEQQTQAKRVSSLRARLADVQHRRLELDAALFDAPEPEARVLRGKRRDLVDDLGALPVLIGDARRREVQAQLAYLYEVARFARETATRLQEQLRPLEAQQYSIKRQLVTAEGLQQAPDWQQRAPLNDGGAWQAQRDAAAAERAQQAQARHTALNAAVAAIRPLQNQQDLALLAVNVAKVQAEGLNARLNERHTWDEAAQQAVQAARTAAERQIAVPLPTERVAA